MSHKITTKLLQHPGHNEWNNLPQSVIEAPSVNAFKNWLDYPVVLVRYGWLQLTWLHNPSTSSTSTSPAPSVRHRHNLLRDCIDALLRFLMATVNASLCEGRLPVSQKKSSSDVHNLKKYRPISNLSFVSKLVERAAVKQLVDYLEVSEFMPKLQSACRKHHSTETAVLRVLSDILTAMDNQLALLDLSAVFHCVDHDILLSRLQSSFG